MSQVGVVIGGGPLSPRVATDVEADAIIIAADSGLDHAVAAGLRPSVLLGDLDSISAHGKMLAFAHEFARVEYPLIKDSTARVIRLLGASWTLADWMRVL